MAKKSANEKRREANRDDAKDCLRAAIKALSGNVDEAKAATEIGKATALLKANEALAVGDESN